MSRFDLSEAEWRLLEPLLPPERRWSEAGIWEAVAKARPGLDWAAFHFNPPGEIQLY